ncbi:polysaccharide pyruvyl transferase CsaB [Desulfotomaculum nigrificans CO-1-SRB]|uniref:Polysaccharide pyruvyl transferase CsaB n=1 Tax=Desulfotomaculum nigrificans (strain DSM 14880 / VKM B-2319 / CO-1-SRB) TaxID=868595 RepID=F6B5H2_DESCC|nr:polysaccharide pyruvyl transferase CsaB [Desulfotomaculum nigrificans]AEF95404.1 polysaccharide pyruvyl transferase CsaB [Desulfotomaculum nigrificans CO-1-SRB]
MAKVVLSGYYGFNNLGDEAVLFSILKTLRDLRLGLRIEVLSNRPEETAEIYKVTAANRWKLMDIYRALKEADMLISGGGSLLQDVTGLKSLIYYLGVIGLARLLGKPVFFYAQGIGPVNSKLGRLLMRLVVNRVNYITVRDESSRQDLADMKITRPRVTVTADPVLGLEQKFIDEKIGGQILQEAGLDLSIERKLVGVSVREWQGLTAYKEMLGEVCDKLARLGYQVVFLPMHYPDDLETSREIVSRMEQPAVVLSGQYSVIEMASLIANMDLLIGMRLHALILAAVMHVPPVALSYDPKIDRFMDLLGRKAAADVANPDFANMWAAVEEIIKEPWLAREELIREVEPLRQQAQRTAALALQVLDRYTGKRGPAAGYL